MIEELKILRKTFLGHISEKDYLSLRLSHEKSHGDKDSANPDHVLFIKVYSVRKYWSGKAMLEGSQAPAGTERAPQGRGRAPAGTERAPGGTERAPARTERAPAQAERAPAQAERAPAGPT